MVSGRKLSKTTIAKLFLYVSIVYVFAAYPLAYLSFRLQRYYLFSDLRQNPSSVRLNAQRSNGAVRKYHLPDFPQKTFPHMDISADGSILVYASASLGAISIVDLRNQEYWECIMPAKLQSSLDISRGSIRRISTDGKHAVVDVSGWNSPSRALIVDLRSGKWSIINRAKRARIDPSGTGDLALMFDDGSIVEKHVGSSDKPVLLAETKEATDWDYCFDDKRLYVIEKDRRYLSIFKDGRTESRRRISTVLWDCRCVRWQRYPRELWIETDGAFTQNANLVFTPEGRYLGGLPSSNLQGYDPLAVNADIEKSISLFVTKHVTRRRIGAALSATENPVSW